jgi:hypothetical protein
VPVVTKWCAGCGVPLDSVLKQFARWVQGTPACQSLLRGCVLAAGYPWIRFLTICMLGAGYPCGPVITKLCAGCRVPLDSVLVRSEVLLE